MIKSKAYVPETYHNESRDYQVFLNLVDLVVNNIYTKTGNMQDLLNPDNCPNEFLQLLTNYVGYDYDYLEEYDVNRIIIKYFTKLLKNRGSKTGIMLAVSLANISAKHQSTLDLNKYSSIDVVEIEKDDEKQKVINVYVHNTEYLTKLTYLLDRVRPAGVKIRILPSTVLSNISKLQTHTYVSVDTPEYTEERHTVDESRVSKGNIVYLEDDTPDDDSDDNYTPKHDRD